MGQRAWVLLLFVAGFVGCADVLGLDDFGPPADGGVGVGGGTGGAGAAGGDSPSGGGTSTGGAGGSGGQGGGTGGTEPLPPGTPLFVQSVTAPGPQWAEHLALGAGDRIFVGGRGESFTLGTIPIPIDTTDAFVAALDGATPVAGRGLTATSVILGDVVYDGSNGAVRLVGGFRETLELASTVLTNPDAGHLGFAASLDAPLATTAAATTFASCGSTTEVRASSWGNGLMAVGTTFSGSSCGLLGLGTVPNAGNSTGDVLVGILDAAGNGVRHCAFGDAGSQGIADIAATTEGHFAAVGVLSGSITIGANTISGGAYVVGVAPQSTTGCGLEWGKALSNGNEVSVRAVGFHAGHVYVAGSFSAATDFGGLIQQTITPASQNSFVMRFTQGGELEWLTHSEGGNTEVVEAMTIGPDGTIYLVGRFQGDIGYGAIVDPPIASSGYLLALEPTSVGLTAKWAQTLVGDQPSYFATVAADAQRVVVTGMITSTAMVAGQPVPYQGDAAVDFVVAAFAP